VTLPIFTIGFTQTSAQHFFTRLRDAGVRTVVDVRLNNTSQLAGFAKSADLAFFLNAITGIAYRHAPELAPEEGMLAAYRKRAMTWDDYRTRFLDLLAARKIERSFCADDLAGSCLLCSEAKPDRCHRRLVCEYLGAGKSGQVPVKHL
jgi:uncharacterized protein (DUF488 family)